MREGESIIRLGDREYVRTTSRVALRPCDWENTPAPVAAQAKAATDSMFWQDDDNPDLVWTKFILDTEGSNDNWDYMPRPSLLKSYASARFKPMDMDHIVEEEGDLTTMDKKKPCAKNTIFGVMTHAALADAEGNLLTDKQIKALANTDDMNRDKADRVTVVAWAALYNFLFPKTVASLVQDISNGQMMVSMERWIRDYDFMVKDGDSYKAYARAAAEKVELDKKWAKREKVGGSPVLRRSNAFLYGGVASTSNPANLMSTFLPYSTAKATASKSPASPVLQALLNRHSEVHTQFAVSCDDQEREQLIVEHRNLHKAIAGLTGN
jgi:hypothetical protein